MSRGWKSGIVLASLAMCLAGSGIARVAPKPATAIDRDQFSADWRSALAMLSDPGRFASAQPSDGELSPKHPPMIRVGRTLECTPRYGFWAFAKDRKKWGSIMALRCAVIGNVYIKDARIDYGALAVGIIHPSNLGTVSGDERPIVDGKYRYRLSYVPKDASDNILTEFLVSSDTDLYQPADNVFDRNYRTMMIDITRKNENSIKVWAMDFSLR